MSYNILVSPSLQTSPPTGLNMKEEKIERETTKENSEIVKSEQDENKNS